jgi:hypothetical protein
MKKACWCGMLDVCSWRDKLTTWAEFWFWRTALWSIFVGIGLLLSGGIFKINTRDGSIKSMQFTENFIYELNFFPRTEETQGKLWSFRRVSGYSESQGYVLYTGCFMIYGKQCRKWFPRAFWSKININMCPGLSIYGDKIA